MLVGHFGWLYPGNEHKLENAEVFREVATAAMSTAACEGSQADYHWFRAAYLGMRSGMN